MVERSGGHRFGRSARWCRLVGLVAGIAVLATVIQGLGTAGAAAAAGPPIEFAVGAGGTGFDEGLGVAIDGFGNTYITGRFSGSATFGATTLVSAGGDAGFVAKLDSAGAVSWATRMGGTASDVAVDGLGNAYVTGRFSGSATFGATTLASAAGSDGFVVKLDSAGAVSWATGMGGTGFDEGSGVAVDDSGNSYITGAFSGSATFGATTLVSAGNVDVFVAKLDSAGAVAWATGTSGTGSNEGSGVAVDDLGNIYITGRVSGSATFGATTLVSAGNVGVFVANLDSAGAVAWATTLNHTGSAVGYGVAVDDLRNIYVTGFFGGSAAFGATTLVSVGAIDVFVAKIPQDFCDAKLVTINMNVNGGDGMGTGSDDVILGTAGSDVIKGFGGADTICAGGGADVVRGGAGVDTIFGEGGSDDIRGGGGGDIIDGGPAPDVIVGQGGTDVVEGGDGADVIDGQGAADTINGGAGADTIAGQNGADIIDGGSGADVLKGQAGPDRLTGAGDNDELFGGNGNDILYGGGGFDKCSGNTGPNDQAEAATCEQTPGVETLF